jgi:hypothetical protein
MAASSCYVGNEEGLKTLVNSVLESDCGSTDLSDYETESEEDVSDYSEDSGESNNENIEIDDRPGPSKRVRSVKQSDWKWEKTYNNPIIYDFCGNNGVCEEILNKSVSEPPSGLQIFLSYMDLFRKIADESNKYATLHLNSANRKKLKGDDKWFETTEDELRAYFALIILMSQVRKPCIQQYWSKDKCMDTPILQETISRERFKLISHFLHFTYDSNADPSDKLKN